MPDSNDLYDTLFRFDSVHNSARLSNDLSDTRVSKFWNNAAGLGKIDYMLNAAKNTLYEPSGCFRTGISDNKMQFP